MQAQEIKKEVQKNNITFSTDLFKDERAATIPSFIRNHPQFTKNTVINKIFPSIGLPNFKETCNIAPPLINLNKGNYVLDLVNKMSAEVKIAIEQVKQAADALQFLALPNEIEANEKKIDALYNLATILTNLHKQLEPKNYQTLVHNVDQKIVLRPSAPILDSRNKADKPAFKANMSLFTIFESIKTQLEKYDLTFVNLQQTNEFKTFNTENVPNKKYSIVFSGSGKEAVWDLLTMSMRGFRSCQRWDGEYKRCLIGSMLSKYVGIIYLTSGSDYENYGSKMMRRCLVRYAIDSSTKKPCILVDQMYPKENGVSEEAKKAFMEAIKSRVNSDIAVYYAPELSTSNKIRLFYMPFEKRRGEVLECEWSYQDTPLKTNLDLKIQSIVSDDEFKCYTSSIRQGLAFHLCTKLSEAANYSSSEAIMQAAGNIKKYMSVNSFIDSFNRNIFPEADRISMQSLKDAANGDIRQIYKRYLLKVIQIVKKSQNNPTVKTNINTIINQLTVVNTNNDEFYNFLFATIFDFIKIELRKLI